MVVKFDYTKYASGRAVERRYLDTQNSPRVNGKLVLQANRLTDINLKVTKMVIQDYEFPPSDTSVGSVPTSAAFNWASIDNIVLAKFNGKLKFDTAALAMTAYTWRQSLGMITGKLGQVHNFLQGVERLLRKKKRRGRRKIDARTDTADAVCEVEFGWKPVISDIKAAFKVLASDLPETRVKATHRVAIHAEKMVSRDLPDRHQTTAGFARCTYSTDVKITNHNLWLLNQLGVIHLQAVAWDAIPWSFVVGAFGNFNQWLQSFTDYVGLERSNEDITRTTNLWFHETVTYLPMGPQPPYGNYGRNEFRTVTNQSFLSLKDKQRTVGTRPKVTFEWRVPEFGLETCVILAGLVTQQMGRITKLATR